MSKFLGRATIRVNGQVIETNSGAELDLGGVTRTVVITGRTVGFAEATAASGINCVTSLKEGQTLEDVRNISEATVIFECDTGQTYVIRNAFIVDPLKVKDGGGGEIPINLAGEPAEEML